MEIDFTLILGANSSGKSLFAETLSEESKKKYPDASLIYLATMIPQTEDNYKRIEKHRTQRREKGFHTIEAGWDIDQLDIPADSVVLLEDISNLLANGIFEHHRKMEDALEQILHLTTRCRKLIAVSIDGLTDNGYDAETAAYINGLNQLNQLLISHASSVYSMENGIIKVLKQA